MKLPDVMVKEIMTLATDDELVSNWLLTSKLIKPLFDLLPNLDQLLLTRIQGFLPRLREKAYRERGLLVMSISFLVDNYHHNLLLKNKKKVTVDNFIRLYSFIRDVERIVPSDPRRRSVIVSKLKPISVDETRWDTGRTVNEIRQRYRLPLPTDIKTRV